MHYVIRTSCLPPNEDVATPLATPNCCQLETPVYDSNMLWPNISKIAGDLFSDNRCEAVRSAILAKTWLLVLFRSPDAVDYAEHPQLVKLSMRSYRVSCADGEAASINCCGKTFCSMSAYTTSSSPSTTSF